MQNTPENVVSQSTDSTLILHLISLQPYLNVLHCDNILLFHFVHLRLNITTLTIVKQRQVSQTTHIKISIVLQKSRHHTPTALIISCNRMSFPRLTANNLATNLTLRSLSRPPTVQMSIQVIAFSRTFVHPNIVTSGHFIHRLSNINERILWPTGEKVTLKGTFETSMKLTVLEK